MLTVLLSSIVLLLVFTSVFQSNLRLPGDIGGMNTLSASSAQQWYYCCSKDKNECIGTYNKDTCANESFAGDFTCYGLPCAAKNKTYCCDAASPNSCIESTDLTKCTSGGLTTNSTCEGLQCNPLQNESSSASKKYCCVNPVEGTPVCADAGFLHSVTCIGGTLTDDPHCGDTMCDNNKEACEIKEVNGILQQCCKRPYTPYYVCQHFSEDFTALCTQAGFSDCKRMDIWCGAGAERSGHQIATVTINGRQCFVEPTGKPPKIISCDDGSQDWYQRTICLARGREFPCDCTLTNDNVIKTPVDFTFCAMGMKDSWYLWRKSECEGCCNKWVNNLHPCNQPNPPELCRNYKNDCYNSCDTILDNSVQCATPGSCVEGYISDTCRSGSCLQEYNTGRCQKDMPNTCLVINRACESPGTMCLTPDDPYRTDPEGIECANPQNCVEGFIPDSCDAASCMREYNTGRCDRLNPNACLIVKRRCESPETMCTPSSEGSVGEGGDWGKDDDTIPVGGGEGGGSW